jgi:membrane-bound lytic murein transglycosylase MltF
LIESEAPGARKTATRIHGDSARLRAGVASLLLALGAAAAGAAESPAVPEEEPLRRLAIANKPWTGDLDRLAERRMIRVLVPHSRTLYFTDKGRERGLTAELVREFEQYLNRKLKTGRRPITIYLLPTTRDQLLPSIAAGLGDIAAGNLTITPERAGVVDFAAQAGWIVHELVVSGADAAPISTLDELGGRDVHVRRSSSYFQSLEALNRRLRSEGKSEARIVLVPDALEDEDLMEMANAGLVDHLIVDDWKARIWAKVLPRVRVHPNLRLAENGQVGWAVRKGSPQLAAAITEFYGSALDAASREYRLAQTLSRVRQIQNPAGSAAWKRFQQLQDLFRRYGEKYGFDPLMLCAQGYQESRLDQEARSAAGAIGIMQLLPATGAEMKVGDITIAEANIHAGAKYMDQLMERYFPDARFSEGNRPLFAFASYNAGPGNISRMRKLAAARGLDPDRWFNHVELVVAEKIGAETTTYVRNIYKYYVAYKLTLEAQEAQREAREALAASG